MKEHLLCMILDSLRTQSEGVCCLELKRLCPLCKYSCLPDSYIVIFLIRASCPSHRSCWLLWIVKDTLLVDRLKEEQTVRQTQPLNYTINTHRHTSCKRKNKTCRGVIPCWRRVAGWRRWGSRGTRTAASLTGPSSAVSANLHSAAGGRRPGRKQPRPLQPRQHHS